MKKPGIYIVPILLMIAGVALLTTFTIANQKAASSDHWSQAIGTITAGGGPGNAVQYRYSAGGKDFSAKSLTHLRAYKTGQRLVIYFDPVNAADATLELGRRPSNWTWVIGTFALLLGFVLALFFSRSPSPARSHNRRLTKNGKTPTPGKKTASRPMQRLRPPQGIDRNKE
jgi:hypothetical protein